MTPDEAFELGWDYPPKMGSFGVVSPRTCGNCGIYKTLWAELMLNGVAPSDLDKHHKETLERILMEPQIIIFKEEENL